MESIEQLLYRVAARDSNAFSMLYEKSYMSMKSVALRVLKDEECAMDVLQDAFIVFWQKAGSYDPNRGCASSWMSAVVRNRALNRIKKKARIESFEINMDNGLEEGEYLHTPEKSFSSFEQNKAVDRALDKIDLESKRAIIMAYYYGYKGEEIASKLQLPLNTVKSKLRRGLVNAREYLSRQYIGSPFIS